MINNLSLKFSSLVKKNPNSKAIKYLNRSYTFNELDIKSNKISNWLISKKIKIDDVICIPSDKSFLNFSLLIACLKNGITYCCIDFSQPNSRILSIIKNIKPKYIITDKPYKKKLGKTKNSNLDQLEKNLFKFSKKINVEQNDIPSSTLAYLMFTSGSTGKPKGVAISHGQLIYFSNWSKIEFNISNKKTLSNLNPLYFDNSVFDIYGGLFNGGSIIPVDKYDLLDTNKTLSILEKNSVNLWFSVPSLLVYFLKLKAFKKNSLKKIKYIIFGGEGFPKKQLKDLYKIFKNRASLINVYGPTECTCICTSYKITPTDFFPKEINKLAPLGKSLISNFKYSIVKKNNKIAKLGQIGELLIGGENVAKGYFNLNEETKTKFIQNPLHEKFIDIVYKSGDLVYQDKFNKKLYFVSRNDNQIKFRGHRIELGEIENIINSFDEIIESAVTFGKKNNLDEITAWVVYKKKSQNLKNNIKNKLPNYMIPQNIIEKDFLPKNNNGKIDRKKLMKIYYDRKKNN